MSSGEHTHIYGYTSLGRALIIVGSSGCSTRRTEGESYWDLLWFAIE